MHVVVCVKQIPDPAVPGALDADNTLKREGKPILDESDSYGVEMALQLRDAAGDGEVILVSLAPNDETAGLRTALAMGADRAILVSDPAFVGSDALTTAKVIAKCVERAGAVDLVLAATESSDGYTGTVPAQVAELLGWPSLTFAKSVALDGIYHALALSCLLRSMLSHLPNRGHQSHHHHYPYHHLAHLHHLRLVRHPLP